MSNVRLRRLQADYEKLRAFLAQQPRIRLIQAQGAPPERYQLDFHINGLREVDEQLQTVANHMVEISLPLSYPRLPQQCRMLTPVFHPNIAPHAICIGDHWSAGEPLWSMVARIGEMIAYQSYNTKSPLNGEAARWVEANQHQLPLDRTNFVMDDSRSQPPASDPPVIPLAEDAAATGRAANRDGAYMAPSTVPEPDRSTALPRPRRVDFSPPNPSPPIPSLPIENAAGSVSPPMAVPPALRPATGRQVEPPQVPQPPAAANIVIECGQCRSRYSVPSTAAGKKVRCKKCQAILVIPQSPSLP